MIGPQFQAVFPDAAGRCLLAATIEAQAQQVQILGLQGLRSQPGEKRIGRCVSTEPGRGVRQQTQCFPVFRRLFQPAPRSSDAR